MDGKWRLRRLVAGLIAFLSVPSFLACVPTTATAEALLKPKHVFIIVLENEGYDVTFGAKSPALYLNALARKGALLRNYYGIGHFSLDNYIAMVSGQAPNPVTQSDCQNDDKKFADFLPKDEKGNGKIDEHGQALGRGCVYPKNVPTIVNHLEAKGLSWKGYMEDMGNNQERDGGMACAHPEIDGKDKAQAAEKGDQYATRHNPFMYFHSIIDDRPNCEKHVVNLSHLARDLEKLETTPNYAFITPNLCHDGHDEPCVDNKPGGLISADGFLMQYVPMILNSPAFGYDEKSGKYNGGLLIITFDESETEDASRCCNEPHGPNIKKGDKVFNSIPDKGPGVYGPGGGRIGAVLVSRYIKEGTVSKVPYNHYSMLRSIADFFGVDHLGYAAQIGLKSFGKEVFTKPGGERY
jgi:hypothetical protein